MDARLEEMIALYAANPATAFADGGPRSGPLPWSGASDTARDTTFARFCVSVALRDYRLPVRGSMLSRAGSQNDVSVDTLAFVDGLADRGLDGLLLAHGNTVLLADGADTASVQAAVAHALALVKTAPDTDLRILFVQAKESERVQASHVSLLGEAAQRFLTDTDYLSVNTKPEVANLWRIYQAVANWYRDSGLPFTPDITLAFAFHGSWRNFGNVRGARNMQLTNLRNAMPGGRFTMDIVDCDDLLEGAIHAGFSIRRDIAQVSAIALPNHSEAPGYLCVIPGTSIIKAFSRSRPNGQEAPVDALDDHFFLDNPRHYLGEAARFNRGASALAANLRQGHPGRVIACHNGIVVVAREVTYDPQSRKLSLVTPQIVNGCQSTYAMQANRDVLDGAQFVVKVVKTASEELKDAVILGSNTQEEVDEYDLLSRNRFIRDLEREFDRHAQNRLWLERRWWERTLWREEDPNFHVPNAQILTPRQLMDGFAASILGRPDIAHGNPQHLLRLVARGEIFRPGHEPTLYRAIGWLIAAGRMWAHDGDEDWRDLPTERGGYGARHQFVHALWRLSEPHPEKTTGDDLAKGRPAQLRFEGLVVRLADPATRRALTADAAEVIERADAEARRQGRDMRNRQSRQWFTELVGREVEKVRSGRGTAG